MADLTPSQTVGPYFTVGFPRTATSAFPGTVPGKAIELFGSVIDGQGDPIPDALLELWQANASGELALQGDAGAPLAPGLIRVATGPLGEYLIRTVVPGALPGPAGTTQAPHFVATVFARGLLNGLVTRIYLPDQRGLDADPVLALVPAHRRHTLIARTERHGRYRADIVLQGPNETVFFDV